MPWSRTGLRAPDAAEGDGRYYLYFSAPDQTGTYRIGAAVAASPEGPFRADSKPFAPEPGVDPAVFRDDDAAYYMFFSGIHEAPRAKHHDPAISGIAGPAPGPMIVRLGPDMRSFREAPVPVIIKDSMGVPLAAADAARRFGGGAWVHKYNERYYLTYAAGNTQRVVYATARNPYGPFTYRGVLLAGRATHASILRFDGHWYLFYHENSPSGMPAVKLVEIGHDATDLYLIKER